MYDPLPSPEEMAHWDRATIDLGLPASVLMENAARAALDELEREVGTTRGKRVLLLAGKGNNGGDALALARMLHCRGADVLVLRLGAKGEYKGEAGMNLRLLDGLDIPHHHARSARSVRDDALAFAPHAVVDGLLGTGFRGELRADYKEWVNLINEFCQRSAVLALDVPTGLDARTGRPSPTAVRANATVSFESAKAGMLLPGAGEYIGRLAEPHIGIPPVVKQANPTALLRMTDRLARLADSPSSEAHKGTFGHLLVLGGSRGLTGAPALSCLGALRGGVGLATAACPGGVATEVKAGLPEAMTFPLGREEHWSSGLVPLLSEELSRFQAVVAGPGMGRDQGAREALEAYLALEDRPDTCFDADALYWLAESPELRSRLRSGDVVTPHPLEAARLLGEKTAHIQADRQAAVGDLASSLGCVAVLKGAGTLVAAPERRIRFCPVAEPALAVAGAGDVLAGLLGAALARGMAPLDAACFAVYVHGFTGSLLGRSNRERGLLASEIADALPRGLKEMRTNANGQRHHEPRGYNPLP